MRCRARLRPTTCPPRRRCRAIWRAPYHGVCWNCASTSRISSTFNSVDRAPTQGKDERGVGYVKRTAIASYRFGSWVLNAAER